MKTIGYIFCTLLSFAIAWAIFEGSSDTVEGWVFAFLFVFITLSVLFEGKRR